MSLYVASLNSGSNGNCYFIGNNIEGVLVDAGISCREIEKRLKRLEISIQKIKGVFISHEHGDHIHGVAALSKKYAIPVYISSKTYKAANTQVEQDRCHFFEAGHSLSIGTLTVYPFRKYHDAADPFSFVVKNQEVSVGVFTDIGRVCEVVIEFFRQCHAVFLETNYDEEMLEKGSYPLALKNRIRNGFGHLSNSQALDLANNHAPAFMSTLFLSHLSKNNNSPERALKAFLSCSKNITVIVAPRDRETALFHIEQTKNVDKVSFVALANRHVSKQLQLFETT